MNYALAQINPTTGDIAGNTAKIIREIETAKQKKADIIVFPELAITGYCISDLIEDTTFVRANRKALDTIIPHTAGITAVIGFIDYDEQHTNDDGTLRKYNAAAVLHDGALAGIAHKTLLANYRYFDDKRYFTPAEQRTPILVIIRNQTFRLGISICEDLWDDSYAIKPISELARKGADIIININASPFSAGKCRLREETIKKHIRAMHKPVIYVNTVGAADNGKNIIPFDGKSVFYDGSGNLIAAANAFEEQTLHVTFDNTTTTLIKNAHAASREQELYDALVMSLRDYARKTGFAQAIVPVSGGIDSALGLAITVDAFGAKNVIAYNLPSRYNTKTTKTIAEQLSKNLDVMYKIIPIQAIDNIIRETFENHTRTITHTITKENLHARIRGMLMMLESNDTGALLISNGNETEIALGYSTLYGDMCGGVSVIGDLSKIDVYALSRYVNEKHGKKIIPEETFTIQPSAELSEGQYDPFDYSVVAPLVAEFAEKRLSPSDLIKLFKTQKLDSETFKPDSEGKTVYDKHTEKTFVQLVQDTYKKLKTSVYKRLQGPPIIVVSQRAFGFDLRETIINKWSGM